MSRHLFAFKIGVNPARSSGGNRDEAGRTSRLPRRSGWCGNALTGSRGWSRWQRQLESGLKPRPTGILTAYVPALTSTSTNAFGVFLSDARIVASDGVTTILEKALASEAARGTRSMDESEPKCSNITTFGLGTS
jgi:hypothetical protein